MNAVEDKVSILIRILVEVEHANVRGLREKIRAALLSLSDWHGFVSDLDYLESVTGVFVLAGSTPINVYPASFVKDGEVFLVLGLSQERGRAKKVRGDSGQAQEGRHVGKAGQDIGSEDLQRDPKEGPEAGDGQAQG